jgi:hypothetical protein
LFFYSNFSESQDDFATQGRYNTLPVFIEYNEDFKKGHSLNLTDERIDFSNVNKQGRWMVLDPLRAYNDLIASKISNNDLFEQATYDRLKAYSMNEFSRQFIINDLSELTFRNDKFGEYYPGSIAYNVTLKFTRAFRGFGDLPGYHKVCFPYLSDVQLTKLAE